MSISKTKRFWFPVTLTLITALGLALGVVILIIPHQGLAQPARDDAPSVGSAPSPFRPAPLSNGRDTVNQNCATVPSQNRPLDVADISDSTVTTRDCYEPNGIPRRQCFRVYNASSDGEGLDQVRLTFPDFAGLGPWTVACALQDGADSSGSPVNFACNATNNEITFQDNDADGYGEISIGSSWDFCVDVTVPGGYDGPRIVNWALSGDTFGGTPHDISGQTSIEQCRPLMLYPNILEVEGCNGITQTHVFELWNNTGSQGDFELVYEVPSGNATFAGPESFSMSAGAVVTFTTQLVPDTCLSAGDGVTATLHAQGNSALESSDLYHTVSALSGWQGRAFSPIPAMDNVVVWASHADGGLWSIGGYGSNGATQRYDPWAGTWSTHTPETVITPTIEYPMDGCYGLNGAGEEVVVLFPDTIVTGSLHIYNITHDDWYTETIPAFYPPEGRWGQDVVSLLNVPGADDNVCYLSGGATQVGGGRTRDLWVYYPALNSGNYVGHFLADAWFGFHASWYVPWIGDQGAICVGGGIDFNSQVNSFTQCYDIAADNFNAANADLGPLPEPWWGMADGWQTYDGRHQIWVANGVARNGTLLPASAYADETTGGFVYGPSLPVGLYRLEGDSWEGHFYTLMGAQGGFWARDYNHLLAQCPQCFWISLPALFRNPSD